MQYAEIIEGFQQLAGEEWIEEELNSEAEVNALIAHFDRTADARYATPQSGLTMLHLACLFKKPELARCLLQDGADPNAQTRDVYGSAASTPLRFAISPGIFEGDTNEKILQLVDLLVAHGAKADGAVEGELGLLDAAAHFCSDEMVARQLLKYVTDVTADDLMLIIERGWADLTEDILMRKPTLTQEEKEHITTSCYIIKGHYDGKINRRLVDIFLRKGVDINTVSLGATPLLTAAAHLNFAEDEQFRNDWVDFIAYLLDKGADATIVGGAESGFSGLCAYDLLSHHSWALEALKARGYSLTAPPLAIREGDELINDLNRAGLRKMSAEEALPYLAQITSVFTPTQDQLRHHSFDTALLSAIEILQRISPQHAADAVNASTLWDMAPHLHEEEEDDLTCNHASAASLIYILQDVKDVCAAPEKLAQVTEQALSINDYNLAASAVELMGRDPQTAEKIEKLTESPHIAVRAGAWNAKLQQAGLPRCTNGAVRDWLAARGREADTPAIKTALLATSLEEMWYGNMPAARKQEFMEALRTINAPEAAVKVYGDYADNMDNPAKLDELEALGKDWRYELEIATARYILQHKADFLLPAATK